MDYGASAAVGAERSDICHILERFITRPAGWLEAGGTSLCLLFPDSRDYRRFVERLGEGVGECHVRLYSYCLMANHYHLVLETPEGNLSGFMQKLSTA